MNSSVWSVRRTAGRSMWPVALVHAWAGSFGWTRPITASRVCDTRRSPRTWPSTIWIRQACDSDGILSKDSYQVKSNTNSPASSARRITFNSASRPPPSYQQCFVATQCASTRYHAKTMCALVPKKTRFWKTSKISL